MISSIMNEKLPCVFSNVAFKISPLLVTEFYYRSLALTSSKLLKCFKIVIGLMERQMTYSRAFTFIYWKRLFIYREPLLQCSSPFTGAFFYVLKPDWLWDCSWKVKKVNIGLSLRPMLTISMPHLCTASQIYLCKFSLAKPTISEDEKSRGWCKLLQKKLNFWICWWKVEDMWL